MFVSAEADSADGQDDGNKVVELLLLGWVLGVKGPHFFGCVGWSVARRGHGLFLSASRVLVGGACSRGRWGIGGALVCQL